MARGKRQAVRTRGRRIRADNRIIRTIRKIARTSRQLIRPFRRRIRAFSVAQCTPALASLRKPGARFTAANLALAAGTMAEAVAPNSDVLTTAGVPADFIAGLSAASDAMQDALQHRSLILGKRSGATSGLVVRFVAAKKVLRAVDSIVVRSLSSDPEMLREWNTVKRIRRTSQLANPELEPALTTAGRKVGW